MLVEDGICYLYRHIRLDNNEVFYVGVGMKNYSCNGFKSVYFRAFQKNKARNKFWRNIVAKTDYKVEILLESDDYRYILEKEKEFVKLYGRRDLGLGTLVNLTDGGDNDLNSIHICRKVYQFDLDFNFIKEWHSAYHIRRELGTTLHGIYKCCLTENGFKTYKGFIWSYSKEIIPIEKGKIKRVAQYSLKGEFITIFDSLEETSKTLNINISSIRYSINNQRPSPEYQFRYITSVNYKDNIGEIFPIYNKSGVNQYDLEGNFIKYWSNITEAASFVKTPHANIIKCLGNRRKSAGGFQWKYGDDKSPITKIKRISEGDKRPILQYDLNMNFIKEYSSSREACRQLGLDFKKLSRYKILNREYGGFYWKEQEFKQLENQ